MQLCAAAVLPCGCAAALGRQSGGYGGSTGRGFSGGHSRGRRRAVTAQPARLCLPTCLSASFRVSLMAVSGAILTTLVPLPLKKARTLPAHSGWRSRQGGAARTARGQQGRCHGRRSSCPTQPSTSPASTQLQPGTNSSTSPGRAAPSADIFRMPSLIVIPFSQSWIWSSILRRSIGAVAERLTAPATPAGRGQEGWT